jgi:hypothetical protein
MSQRHSKTLVKPVVSIEEEIKRRISLGNKAFYANQDLFKSKLLTKNSKLRMYKTLVRPVVTYACEMSVQKENKKTKLKVALHARVNYRESYREHLATKFRHESKSWLAGSLRSLLRVPELRDLSEHKVSVYT